MLSRFQAINNVNAHAVLPQSESVSSVEERVQRG
jgi:hypothetical protein